MTMRGSGCEWLLCNTLFLVLVAFCGQHGGLWGGLGGGGVLAASLGHGQSEKESPLRNNKQTSTANSVAASEVGMSEEQMKENVEMIIKIQKLTEDKEGIKHSMEEEKNVNVFYETDIVLTQDQAEVILHDVEEQTEHRKRKKRKLAEPLAKRWPTNIPYIFDGTHNRREKYRIKQALAYWEDQTCIKFVEDDTASHKLSFHKGRGCWSYVGFTHQATQIISIGDGCQSNGTIAHEVGHAIGFWHEQSRPDRDTHIKINKNNVTEGKLYNFDKRSWSEIITLDIPYDLGSDMHYGSKFYAKDENSTYTTVEPIDKRMMRTIGQRHELSFFDVHLANRAYCDAICSDAKINLTEPCQREGYQDPKNCHSCRCPDGFGGDFCQRPADPKNAYCGGTLLAAYNGTIYSPGFPIHYRPEVQCSWLIKAPEGSQVYLEFDKRFGIIGHEDVCKDFVEVRYNSSLSLTGARFCMEEAPPEPVRSDSNELMVLFRSYAESLKCDDSKYPWKCKFPRRGFKAKYYIQSCGGCDGRGRRQLACVRRKPYVCAQSWQDKTEIACPSWWYTEGCGVQTVTKTRYAHCHRDEKYCCDGYEQVGDMCEAVRREPSNIIPVSPASPVLPGVGDEIHTGPGGHSDQQFSQPGYNTPGIALYPGGDTRDPSYPQQPANIWSDWSGWSACSVKCGGGMAVRTRTCLSPGYCGSSNIQADKRPCAQNPCYKSCQVERVVLCDLWTKCTKTMTQRCPYCYAGYMLQGNTCIATRQL